MTPFGLYVRSLRLVRQVSMKTMADALGVSPSYLSVLEQGKRGIPNLEMLDRIARYFDLSEDQRAELTVAAEISQVTFDIPSDSPPEAYRIAHLFSKSAAKMDSTQLKIIQLVIEAGEKWPTCASVPGSI